MNLSEKLGLKNSGCQCGKEHAFYADVLVGTGVIGKIPEMLKERAVKSVFLLADRNTYAAAGEQVSELLTDAGICVHSYIFEKQALEPDETNVGLAFMHFTPDCDMVIGVGSGVINDIGKILAYVSAKPYMIVGTAPSMDGYASATSSMTVGGLKMSLPSKCADIIVGDTQILCRAPKKLMVAGLGDMLAKYVSICEWRISHLINEEYYCPEIAQLVREALMRCVSYADGLLKREPAAVQSVFEGLVLCGAAMKYAGVSRPASGVEHYLSHVWDMRGAQFGTPVELHGIQCAVGTLIAVGLYEKVKRITPDRNKAKDYVKAFDYGRWSQQLRDFLGNGAEDMIRLEKKEGKYDLSAHELRLERIIESWPQILEIMEQELPDTEELERLLERIGCPTTLGAIGQDEQLLKQTFETTKDIRDKYVLSRLVWDLGIIDDML